MSRRAVVVGAGAIGVASAYYMSRSGWQVTVVDRGDIAGGASYGNACLIVPSHSHPLPGPRVVGRALRWMLRRDSPFYIRPRLDTELLGWLWRFRSFCNERAAEDGFRALVELSRASLEIFEELAGALGFYYERKGLLHVYVTEEGFRAAEQERDGLESSGFRTRLLTARETHEMEPALVGTAHGGLFIESEAHGYCYGYVQAMARTLTQEGVTFLTGRPVTQLVVERGRAQGVVVSAPEERISAELVVLAAGSWSPGLARGVGLRIPLQPAKGYSSTIDRYPGSPSVPLLVPERRVIVTPLGDRLRFGGTLELAGYDERLNSVRYQAILRGAREILGDRFEMRNEEAWCGFRPVLPDGLPIIDWARNVDGLILATGHAMLGFTQSPITGKLVAQLANREAPSVPLERFRSDRF